MRTSINYTTFAAPKVALEILAAMIRALKTGDVTRLVNRKGEPWLLVTITKDDLGYRFAFIDTSGTDQRHNVQQAAMSKWCDEYGYEFWAMTSKSFDLTRHPMTAFAEDCHLTDTLKAHGATHKVITYGGAVVGYGGYQRNWYGKKCLYLLAGKDGKPYGKAKRMNTEAALMVARLEAL